MGMDVKVSTTYSWVLNKQLVRIEHTMKSEDCKFSYEGLGYLKPTGKNKATLRWFDDWGFEYTGEGNWSDDGKLITEFTCNHNGKKMYFKMEAEFGEDEYKETMFMKAGKKWSEMAKVSYTKIKTKKD